MDEERSPFRNRGRRGEEGESKRKKEAPAAVQVADPCTLRQQLPRAATAAAAVVLSRDSSIIRG